MTASKIIEVATSYIGYLEKKSDAQLEDKTANAGNGNFTKFGEWYDEYYKTKGFNGAAWCHGFVSYCAMKVGIGPDIIPYTASCTTGVNWFKQRGRFKDRTHKPQSGDIIYFADSKGPAHVGIVTKSDASRVYTIEGNTSGGSTLVANGGGVAAKSYPLTYAPILGYGTPAYKDEIAECEKEIQKHFNLSDPDRWFKPIRAAIGNDPYAETFYRKWAESYK